MKYIRTKDGHIFPYRGTDKNYIYQEYGDFKSSPIIQRANTIEELCDEFVVIDKTWEEPLHIVLDTKDDMESYLPNEIYGAIWTDKGLIYVAKMNEKGELELL